MECLDDVWGVALLRPKIAQQSLRLLPQKIEIGIVGQRQRNGHETSFHFNAVIRSIRQKEGVALAQF
jgi:hypothetical protein